MARGVLMTTAFAGGLAALVGLSGFTGTPLSQVLLACGIVAALSLSRTHRGE